MKLFLGDKCWDKLFELPKNVQLRVRDFQRKFKENPRSAAINLEKIQDFLDSYYLIENTNAKTKK